MHSGGMDVYITMYIYNEVVMYIMCTHLMQHTLLLHSPPQAACISQLYIY